MFYLTISNQSSILQLFCGLEVPKCLYAAETLVLDRNPDSNQIQKREKKMFGKVIDNEPQKYGLCGNREIKEYTDIH